MYVVENVVVYVNMSISQPHSQTGVAKQPMKSGGDKKVIYLVQCKTCHIQYIGSMSTKFRMRFNNYKSCLGKHNSNESVCTRFISRTF